MAMVIGIGFLLVVGLSSAATIYVDDSNTGTEDGTAAHPYNTIQEGINEASDNDDVEIAEGSYSSFCVDGDDNSDSLRIYCAGYPVEASKETVTISGLSGTNMIELCDGATEIVIAGLILDGNDVCDQGVLIDGCDYIYLYDLEIKEAGKNGVYVKWAENFKIIDCHIHDNAFSGIRVVGISGSHNDAFGDITHTDSRYNDGHGIAIIYNDGTGDDIIIDYVRCRLNGDSNSDHGIYIDANSANVYIDHATIKLNYYSGIETDSDDNVEIMDCDLYGNGVYDGRDDSTNGALWYDNYYSSHDPEDETYLIPGNAGAEDSNPEYPEPSYWFRWEDDTGETGDHPALPTW